MSIILGHISLMDLSAFVAVFALGWFLGGLATAKLLRRSPRSTRL